MSGIDSLEKLEAIQRIGGALYSLGAAITPSGVGPGEGANGGTVTSLTEAVMDAAESLARIASAIEDLAAAVRETKTEPE